MAIQSVTVEGVPEGSNLAVDPHEIADTQARYIQDGLLDQVGLVYRRGPVTPAAGITTFGTKLSGIAHCYDPANTHRVAVLRDNGGTSLFSVLSDDYTTKTDLTWFGTLPVAPYYVVDSKPALNGGAFVGTGQQPGSGTRALALWRGANKANYTTGTITVTRGSKTVTGSATSWSGNVVPGMFLFGTADDPASTVYFGVIKSVDSNTQITLEFASPFAATAKAYTAQTLRGVCIRNRTGRITTDGTTTVQGAATKFKSNGLDSGDWRLYRASDGAFIGKVSTVADDTALTLAAASAITVTNESFIALRADGNYSLDATLTGKPGFISAIYAQRQWFASGSTIRYSSPVDPEAMDMDPVAGDFIPVTSARVGGADTDIAQIVPSYNAMLVLKENEVFGLFGQDESQFAIKKIADDGTLSGMSVQQYEGGVIWAGREGIYTYDGTTGLTPENFVEDRLGSYYKKLVRDFDPTTHRMWSMLERDHYKLHIESISNAFVVRKGSTGTAPTRTTISIYLPTRAVTFDTNLDIRGAIQMPAATAKGVWYIVNSATTGYICAANDLHETTGNDTITCDGNTAGPDFYLESKRYSLGDSLLKKLFKQLLLHYYVGGDDLKFDTIVGLNELGSTSASRWLKSLLSWDSLAVVTNTWDALSTAYATWDDLALPRFVVKRIKFLKRSQHFGFRIYQASSSVNDAKLGPWSIGFKPQRVGRM